MLKCEFFIRLPFLTLCLADYDKLLLLVLAEERGMAAASRQGTTVGRLPPPGLLAWKLSGHCLDVVLLLPLCHL